MEELLQQLKQIKKGVDFENEEELFDGGFLDSFDVIRIISMIKKEYEIVVPPSHIVPENFNSAKAILAMIEELEDE